MQKINILYVLTKLELGGAQKQLLSLITGLNKERYNIYLFTASNGLLLGEAISIKGLRLIRSRFLERSLNPASDLLALFEIYSFIKKNNINIVHTHSSKAGIIGRWAARLACINITKGDRKIILHTVHGWSFNSYQHLLLRQLIIFLEKFTAIITDKLIVVSEHDLEKGLNNHIGNKHKYKLIRYGIDYDEFTAAGAQIQSNLITTHAGKSYKNLRAELGIGVGDVVVGMISCFKPQKRPQDFIRLADRIWNSQSLDAIQASGVIKFLLVGDGILRAEIEKLISKLNLTKQVILTGWRRDISAILSIMDIFVLTSLWEGLPIAVLEAMKASKPVLATNTGGIAEIIVEGQTGFLAAPGDIDIMAQGLGRLLKDGSLRQRMGQEARDSLGSDFKVGTMVMNTKNLYQELAENKIVGYAN